MQPPGPPRRPTEALGPFHRQQRPQLPGDLLLLGEQLIGGGGLLQPIQIQVHQGSPLAPITLAAIRLDAIRLDAIVLGQGKGGAGNRLVDAQAGGEALHQAGLAGAEVALQQQGERRGQPLPGQLTPQSPGGLHIRQLP